MGGLGSGRGRRELSVLFAVHPTADGERGVHRHRLCAS